MTIIYPMTDVAPTISRILGLPVPADAQGHPIEAIVADLSELNRYTLNM
jgi:hypothetical protein